jgi:hypothetical protein
METPKENPYEDIIHLNRPSSRKHRPMSMIDRAAQFSPFAALVGYNDQLADAARYTDTEVIVDEDKKYIMDLQLQYVLQNIAKMPEVTVRFFSNDEMKSGGKYITISGKLKKVLSPDGILIFADGTEISMRRIVHMEIPLLEENYNLL